METTSDLLVKACGLTKKAKKEIDKYYEVRNSGSDEEQRRDLVEDLKLEVIIRPHYYKVVKGEWKEVDIEATFQAQLLKRGKIVFKENDEDNKNLSEKFSKPIPGSKTGSSYIAFPEWFIKKILNGKK
jgi:hypothetical protein